jgi:hypothetical protein
MPASQCKLESTYHHCRLGIGGPTVHSTGAKRDPSRSAPSTHGKFADGTTMWLNRYMVCKSDLSSYLCLVGLAAQILMISGCMPDTTPPGDNQGTCNKNGKCEQDLVESCVSCPDDCPCCYGMVAIGNDGKEHSEAEGKADSKLLSLGGSLTTVEISFGSGVHDGDGMDIEIYGSVTSGNQASSTDCPETAVGSGSFVISVRDPISLDWYDVGLWSKNSASSAKFDIGCGPGGLGTLNTIRIEAQVGATGKLDGIYAISCVKPQ